MRLRTVRARILVSMVALAGVALVLSGGTAYVLQRNALLTDIDETLKRHASEFQTLAQSGTDPFTAAAFSTADDLVTAAIRLTAPAEHEGVIGLRDGKNPLVPGQEGALRLQDDNELLGALETRMHQGAIAVTTIHTSQATYRALVAPVNQIGTTATTDSQPQAAFVVAVDRDAQLDSFNTVFRTYFIVAAIALAMTASVGWIIAGRLLRPIRNLSAAARKVSDEDLSGRVETEGDTDLADVAQTFNDMLDRLEQAFVARSALLDDVSHELRTPLTVVRGHLELMDTDDRSDVESTRAIALDEIDRMDRLVTDLSTLATADSPDFIRPQLADLGTLTDEVFDKVRSWSGHQWQVTGRAEVTLSCDPQRVTQAWLQLCANAAKFSDEHTTIEIGSDVSNNEAVIWVTDHGYGIEAEDLTHITERFARAHTSRNIPGAGLGLSIVDAIAARHGGHLSFTSEVGVGTTVTIHLPLIGHADTAIDPLTDLESGDQ